METGVRTLSEQDLRDVSSTKQVQYGALGQTEDGRIFRYAGAGASQINAGNLAVAAAVVANHTNVTASVTAAGAKKVVATLGATAATQDQYAEGFLVVNAGTGAGTSYRIAGNGAAASAGSITVTLAEPIVVALDGTSKVSLVASPFSNVITSTTVAKAVGVATVAIPANNFGWVQTYGYCSALSDVSVASKGNAVKQSVTTAGAITVAAAATDQIIAFAPEAGVSAEFRGIWLQID